MLRGVFRWKFDGILVLTAKSLQLNKKGFVLGCACFV